LLLSGGDGRDVLIRSAALMEVTGATQRAASPVPTVMSRTPVTVVLRRLAVDRATVTVELVDGSVLAGTLDWVGTDAVDLLDARIDEPTDWPSADSLGVSPRTRLVPLAAISVVRER
jgi:hypothetical protein